RSLADDMLSVHNIPVKQGYGLTETSPVISLVDEKKIIKGSVGLLLPNVEAKIVAENGQELGYNESGQLCLRGPNVMKGYLNNKEATDASFDKDGFLYTGDVAVMDEQENLYITDRIKELIKYKGFQVAPAELEEILISHPAVSDAAVVGFNCEADATEYPLAYVTLKVGHEQSPELLREIQNYVTDQVAPHKRLRDVICIDQIPKSASGKLLRRVLREKAKAEYVLSHRK
ncbi:9040_t:CDS:2, partial [Acaulospora morrowiae]